MTKPLITNNHYLKSLIDLLPSSLLVVDRKFNICDMNPAARKLFGVDAQNIVEQLCGEILLCLHALESKKGCGTTEFCADCVIRNSIETAYHGNYIFKQKHLLKVKKDGVVKDLHIHVTSAPFNYEGRDLVILVIEDITDLTLLKRILPICSCCKKIRNDEDYWDEVSTYLRKNADLEFTHSICPECAEKNYPDLFPR